MSLIVVFCFFSLSLLLSPRPADGRSQITCSLLNPAAPPSPAQPLQPTNYRLHSSRIAPHLTHASTLLLLARPAIPPCLVKHRPAQSPPLFFPLNASGKTCVSTRAASKPSVTPLIFHAKPVPVRHFSLALCSHIHSNTASTIADTPRRHPTPIHRTQRRPVSAATASLPLSPASSGRSNFGPFFSPPPTLATLSSPPHTPPATPRPLQKRRRDQCPVKSSLR